MRINKFRPIRIPTILSFALAVSAVMSAHEGALVMPEKWLLPFGWMQGDEVIGDATLNVAEKKPHLVVSVVERQ